MELNVPAVAETTTVEIALIVLLVAVIWYEPGVDGAVKVVNENPVALSTVPVVLITPPVAAQTTGDPVVVPITFALKVCAELGIQVAAFGMSIIAGMI